MQIKNEKMNEVSYYAFTATCKSKNGGVVMELRRKRRNRRVLRFEKSVSLTEVKRLQEQRKKLELAYAVQPASAPLSVV